MDLSVFELWQSTGPLARGVVLVLGGMSVVATAIGLEKFFATCLATPVFTSTATTSL